MKMTRDSWNDRDIDLFHANYKAKQETVHFGTPELQESAIPVQLGVPYRLKASNESWSRKLPGSAENRHRSISKHFDVLCLKTDKQEGPCCSSPLKKNKVKCVNGSFWAVDSMIPVERRCNCLESLWMQLPNGVKQDIEALLQMGIQKKTWMKKLWPPTPCYHKVELQTPNWQKMQNVSLGSQWPPTVLASALCPFPWQKLLWYTQTVQKYKCPTSGSRGQQGSFSVQFQIFTGGEMSLDSKLERLWGSSKCTRLYSINLVT